MGRLAKGLNANKNRVIRYFEMPTHYRNENSNENWINAMLYFVTCSPGWMAKTRYWKIHLAIKNDRKLARFGKKCTR